MRSTQQKGYEALTRVRGLFESHPEVFGMLAATPGARQVSNAVERIAAVVAEQAAAALDARAAASRVRAVSTELQESHMAPMATFARSSLRGAPDFAALTKSGSGMQKRAMAHAARAMATAAAPHAAVFADAGFPSNSLAALAAEADALDAALDARQDAEVRRAKATAAIDTTLKSGGDGVRMLDPVIRKLFGKDKAVLAQWRAARRVQKSSSPRIGGAVAPNPSPVSAAPSVNGQ
jgi:hypothetical protein